MWPERLLLVLLECTAAAALLLQGLQNAEQAPHPLQLITTA